MSIHIIKGVQTKGVPKFPRDMSENNDKICNPTFDQNKLKTIPLERQRLAFCLVTGAPPGATVRYGIERETLMVRGTKIIETHVYETKRKIYIFKAFLLSN